MEKLTSTTLMENGRNHLLVNLFPSSTQLQERFTTRFKVITSFLFFFNHVYDFSCFGSFLQSELQVPFIWLIGSACTQEEVNKVMESAKTAQKLWAKTPLWKRAELLHKAASILKEHKAPIAECLVKEIAKPAKDAVTEVSISITFIF